eukprot:TRINITY_DN7971_c0_g1_i1.p2 TRINITY_DN7971_c0_g1~~TRINITY_DN7971_c0_g1_i1.p2  ORF type:complete len:244 (+),score=63.29 TRINITY_DN7971_c0_g1_i1:24-734(+)
MQRRVLFEATNAGVRHHATTLSERFATLQQRQSGLAARVTLRGGGGGAGLEATPSAVVSRLAAPYRQRRFEAANMRRDLPPRAAPVYVDELMVQAPRGRGVWRGGRVGPATGARQAPLFAPSRFRGVPAGAVMASAAARGGMFIRGRGRGRGRGWQRGGMRGGMRGGTRGGMRGGARGGRPTQASREQLDDELDNYMQRSPMTQRERLDAELDSYQNEPRHEKPADDEPSMAAGDV